MEDRLTLIEESWKNLFVLGAAQFLYPMNLNLLLDRSNSICDGKNGASLFELALIEVSKVSPDPNEYACLRAVLLFKTCWEGDGGSSPSHKDSDSLKLKNAADVTSLYDQSVYMLSEVSSVWTFINPKVAELFETLSNF